MLLLLLKGTDLSSTANKEPVWESNLRLFILLAAHFGIHLFIQSVILSPLLTSIGGLCKPKRAPISRGMSATEWHLWVDTTLEGVGEAHLGTDTPSSGQQCTRAHR